MKSIDRLTWLNTMIRNLKFWRDRHIEGSDTSAIDSVIAEMEHYANVEAGLCELDLEKFPLVALGSEVTNENLEEASQEIAETLTKRKMA